MDPLSEHVTEGHFEYTQASRQGDLAIYTQTHQPSGVVRYEVVRIRESTTHTWPSGITSPAREVYPSAGKWGTDGWTFSHLGRCAGLAPAAGGHAQGAHIMSTTHRSRASITAEYYATGTRADRARAALAFWERMPTWSIYENTEGDLWVGPPRSAPRGNVTRWRQTSPEELDAIIRTEEGTA